MKINLRILKIAKKYKILEALKNCYAKCFNEINLKY